MLVGTTYYVLLQLVLTRTQERETSDLSVVFLVNKRLKRKTTLGPIRRTCSIKRTLLFSSRVWYKIWGKKKNK